MKITNIPKLSIPSTIINDAKTNVDFGELVKQKIADLSKVHRSLSDNRIHNSNSIMGRVTVPAIHQNVHPYTQVSLFPISSAVSALRQVAMEQEKNSLKYLTGDASLSELLESTKKAENAIDASVNIRNKITSALDNIFNMHI